MNTSTADYVTSETQFDTHLYAYSSTYQSFNETNSIKMNSIDNYNQSYAYHYYPQNYSYYQQYNQNDDHYHQQHQQQASFTNGNYEPNYDVNNSNNNDNNHAVASTTDTATIAENTPANTSETIIDDAIGTSMSTYGQNQLINTCDSCNRSFSSSYQYTSTCDSCLRKASARRPSSLDSNAKCNKSLKKLKKLKKQQLQHKYESISPNNNINNLTSASTINFSRSSHNVKYNLYIENELKTIDSLKKNYKMILHAIKLAITRKRDSIKEIYLSQEMPFNIIQDLIRQHLFELTKSIITNTLKIFYDQENTKISIVQDDLKLNTNFNKSILIAYLFLIDNIDNFDSIIDHNNNNNNNSSSTSIYFKFKLQKSYTHLDAEKIYCNLNELKMLHFALILINYFLCDSLPIETIQVTTGVSSYTCMHLLSIMIGQLCHDKKLKNSILLSLSEM